tara:strand:- start:26871 stop:27035 length:165 start_codon:yes stop_codon:yes gene_type:complete
LRQDDTALFFGAVTPREFNQAVTFLELDIVFHDAPSLIPDAYQYRHEKWAEFHG